MRRTKARRDIAPAFTWSNRPRKSRSFIGCPPIQLSKPSLNAPAILQDACKRDGNRTARRRQPAKVMQAMSRTKPSRYPLLLAALIASSWSWARAADPAPGIARDCTKIDDYREMVDCFAVDARVADAELARVYDTLLNALGASLQRDLLA